MSARHVTEDELHAWVDDQLDPADRARVEAHLARNPAAADAVARFERQRAALRELLMPIAEEPLPPRFERSGLTLVARGRASRPRVLLVAAAAVCLFGAGVGAGYELRAALQPPNAGVLALASEAADSYRVHASDPARPIEVPAADKAELVRWFSERLQSRISVPDLELAGYRFLGGRLVTTPHGAAALFVYDDARGAKLAVLVRPMAIERNTRMSERVDGVLGTVAWADEGIGYSLVGRVAPSALHPLANEVRRQLRRASDG